MPYIKLADRPIFDTMIDGLIPKIRGFDRPTMGKVAANLVVYALTPRSISSPVENAVDDIVAAIGKRIRVRGDANYCVCRILLEGMKPEKGWSYHSLSDTVMACDAAIDLVYDVQREQKLEDAQVADAISVLGDVVVEIERRLLGPYEDTAILKNGDLACFANESFAYKPLDVLRAYSGRATCGCVCDPCQCEPESDPLSGSPLDDLLVIKGDGPIPPITEAITQDQCDAVDQERQQNE